MIKLYDALLTDILPDIFSDAEKTKAYAMAERAVRQKIYDAARIISVYANMDILPDDIHDLMAKENKTPYYTNDMPREKKVELIRGTMRWHTTAGTVDAVQKMIDTVFGEGTVKEWFEYDGEPFYFRISTSTEVTPEKLEQFRDVIRKVKNTSSTLEKISLENDIAMTINEKGGVFVETFQTIQKGENHGKV